MRVKVISRHLDFHEFRALGTASLELTVRELDPRKVGRQSVEDHLRIPSKLLGSLPVASNIGGRLPVDDPILVQNVDVALDLHALDVEGI